jgi:hypothetical protein
MSRHQTQTSMEDEQIIKKKALECVEYILFCVLGERKSIVRKTDLNKNVIKDYSRLFKQIFGLVKVHLFDVFGLQIIDLDHDKGDKYGIRSKFEYDPDLYSSNLSESAKHLRDFGNEISSSEIDKEFEDQLKYSILMVSLSLIFMNGNEIDSGLFWDSLKRVDVNKDEKRHKYLGDVHKYFTVDLVKEGYLEYEQIPGMDPPAYKLKWGQRAKLEITKKSVLNFVCEVYGGLDTCKPNEWLAQHADAIKRDEFNRESDDEDTNETEMECSTSNNTQMARQTQDVKPSTQRIR